MFRFTIRSYLLATVGVVLLITGLGAPQQTSQGWRGAGWFASWIVWRSIAKPGIYIEVWSDPDRTAVPIDMAFNARIDLSQ